MDNLTTINVKISKKDKKVAMEILQKLGITMNEFINMTIKEVIIKNGIPFDVTIPNEYMLEKTSKNIL